ncbi:MAG: MotA/TolQ/ExbB proton channel family protein [Kiritimatiellae bacterium]|nr:MotA/TolQ/ExbB proton channel family protein [Kiritimatiellia bacterium]
MAFLLAEAEGSGSLVEAVKKTADAGQITFGQAWNDGGVLMWVLAGFSVLSLASMLYLLFSQRREIFVPEALSRIRSAKDPAAEGSRIAESVMSAVDWLADIAAIAPLVGLLGTVYGIFEAFNIPVSQDNQMTRASALTHGVSKAVVTTIFGLIVSIPTLFAHAIFRRRAARLVATLEEAAEKAAAFEATRAAAIETNRVPSHDAGKAPSAAPAQVDPALFSLRGAK